MSRTRLLYLFLHFRIGVIPITEAYFWRFIPHYSFKVVSTRTWASSCTIYRNIMIASALSCDSSWASSKAVLRCIVSWNQRNICWLISTWTWHKFMIRVQKSRPLTFINACSNLGEGSNTTNLIGSWSWNLLKLLHLSSICSFKSKRKTKVCSFIL